MLQQTYPPIPQPIYLMGPALLWQMGSTPAEAAPDLIAVIRGLDTLYTHARGIDSERDTATGLDTQYIRLRGRD